MRTIFITMTDGLGDRSDHLRLELLSGKNSKASRTKWGANLKHWDLPYIFCMEMLVWKGKSRNFHEVSTTFWDFI